MIIPFVFTLDTVGDGCQLTWVFNKAVSFSKNYEWPVIAQKQYFDHYLEDTSVQNAEYSDYDVPQPEFLSKITSIIIPEELVENYISKFPSQIDAYLNSVRYEWKEMTEFLIDVIYQVEKKYGEKVEAIMSMRYYKFLNEACINCGVSTLYYEWGPFRAPNYRNTAYLDFKGLQGNASIKENYILFKEQLEKQEIPILNSKEILSLFLKRDKLNYLWKNVIPEYEIGITAGYTTPCVTTPYNAITLDEMVYRSRKIFQPNEISIRLHPGDPLKTQPSYGQVDSGELLDFILKSKRIVCNGSNMAYEAALYNRPTYDLGWSQFSFMVNTTLNGLEDKVPDKQVLSFVAFGALIPFELLNSVEYLRFRLNKPSLVEIYLYHLRYYLESYGANLDLLNKSNFMEQLCEMRLHSKGVLDVSAEFQKYYSFSLDEIKYQKMKNDFLNLQAENRTYMNLLKEQKCHMEEQNKKITELQNLLRLSNNRIQFIEDEKENAENNLKVMMDSNIYKATKPLRMTLDTLKKMF